MNSAKYVDNKIQQLRAMVKESGMPMSEAIFSAAKLCIGWAYVFGAKGDYCDPENRRRRYSDKHPTIKTKCKNFSGAGTCNGCQWYPDGERTRFFDCRGFTYWILNQMCDWKLYGETTVTQWGKASNWKAKGQLSDGYPRDTIMCLFQYDNAKKKMIHTGFGYNDETCECQKGVEYHKPRDRKWTHWAVPACIEGDIPDPQPEPGKKPTLRKGSTGKYVVECQEDLIKLGYNVGEKGADGKFGAATEKAVKEFQRDNGLTEDGVVGQKTWDALDNAKPKPDPGPEPQPVKHKTLRKGDSGEEVFEMQMLLLDHGEALPKYGADGKYGQETVDAVKNFQMKNGLSVDGICGPKTWAALLK